MKGIALSIVAGLLALSAGASELKWTTDLPAALAQAKKENKAVLVNFTGSDWCGWCIKLDKEVFSKKEFQEYADKNLVLVVLDFPRTKRQSAELTKTNEKLKAKHAVSGFPTILVLDGDGKQLLKQVGYLAGGPSIWIPKIDTAKKG